MAEVATFIVKFIVKQVLVAGDRMGPLAVDAVAAAQASSGQGSAAVPKLGRLGGRYCLPCLPLTQSMEVIMRRDERFETSF